MYDHTFYKLANQQIRHQAPHKVGSQPGDFAYGHFNIPQGFVSVYITVNILTLSQQRGGREIQVTTLLLHFI